MRRYLFLVVLACAHACLHAAPSDDAPASAAANPSALQPDKPVPSVKPLCFKFSKLCIGRKPAPGIQAKPIEDLEVTRAELAWILAQLNLPEDDDTLEVRGQRERDNPQVPGGVLSVIWAVKNPTQSWRIFTPIPAEETK